MSDLPLFETEADKKIAKLEERVADLSRKLDQALEYLTIEQRAMILCQWGAV